ncbi:Peptidase family M48 [Thermoanaerobacter thermohydrosulfuricus]|uniref:Peptidase family M48 n=1 Tax=Thermoanaerobacter thermohydrosulfuricus TaxID=1516 RepID=A0A1G7WAW7_THETY|nr:M48 family metalloprotease [Thermoanaerobacter thermohydrosulfuricus]SDG69135.1 Peptidase family M48 [Thermoanaerobacter thermohydrosulfuricus]
MFKDLNLNSSNGIMLVLTVLINWIILTLFLSGLGYYSLIWSTVIMFGFIGLAFTPTGENIVRVFWRLRKPTQIELHKIQDSWEAVVKAANLKNLDITPEVFISDQPFPNAFAIGTRTIALTRGLLEVATPEELSGVLAHEMGHLVNGDTKRRLIAAVANTIGNIVVTITATLLTIMGFTGQIFSQTMPGSSSSHSGINEAAVARSAMGFMSLMLSLFAIILKLVQIVVNYLITIGLNTVGRKEEFRADDFAKQFGFAEGLASFLRKTEHLDIQPNGFWEAVSRTHPPTAVRIDRLLYGE